MLFSLVVMAKPAFAQRYRGEARSDGLGRWKE